jgi:hypothetical protein
MRICLGEWDIGAAALGALVSALSAALVSASVWARLDLGCLSSGALGGLVGPTMAATVDSGGLTMGALAVTGHLSLADTVATVDSATDGISKLNCQNTGWVAPQFKEGSAALFC